MKTISTPLKRASYDFTKRRGLTAFSINDEPFFTPINVVHSGDAIPIFSTEEPNGTTTWFKINGNLYRNLRDRSGTLLHIDLLHSQCHKDMPLGHNNYCDTPLSYHTGDCHPLFLDGIYNLTDADAHSIFSRLTTAENNLTSSIQDDYVIYDGFLLKHTQPPVIELRSQILHGRQHYFLKLTAIENTSRSPAFYYHYDELDLALSSIDNILSSAPPVINTVSIEELPTPTNFDDEIISLATLRSHNHFFKSLSDGFLEKHYGTILHDLVKRLCYNRHHITTPSSAIETLELVSSYHEYPSSTVDVFYIMKYSENRKNNIDHVVGALTFP